MSTILNDRKLTDVNLSFTPNPNTGEIAKLNSFSVVRRSLELIMTMGILDKPFREDIGSSINTRLFEVASSADIPAFESQLRNAIERYEPRIGIRDLSVLDDLSNNRLQVTLRYFIRDTQREDTFSTVLNLSE